MHDVRGQIGSKTTPVYVVSSIPQVVHAGLLIAQFTETSLMADDSCYLTTFT